MKTYTQLDESLQGRCKESRKVGNHTYLKRRGDNIALQYWNTDIITWHKDGKAVVNVGCWKTVSTMARINEWFGRRIHAHKCRWYWSCRPVSVPFVNGDWFNGNKSNLQGLELPEYRKSVIKDHISSYAERVADMPAIGDASPIAPQLDFEFVRNSVSSGAIYLSVIHAAIGNKSMLILHAMLPEQRDHLKNKIRNRMKWWLTKVLIDQTIKIS